MTLYRIGKDPAIFYILREAVRRGIKVCVNIELHASGESINRMWLEELEEAGIKVTTYASGELKVHCKLTLVKFNNGRSIAQIGTGNYHTKTTVQYTDLSLITGNENICHQVEKVFDLLDDEKDCVFNKNLLVTRYNARQELIKLIDHEADKGNKGYICIKCNALDDGLIKLHLDQAAKCGCNIDLIIRGVCTWIPDQLGDNVNIKSIVWDKLEHSRVYCFGRKNPAIYIGSLDLVTKKIDERIETLVLVTDPEVEMKMAEYLNRYITNTEGSWKLLSNGEYVKE
jgi:polyphosphate kinase